METTRSAKFLRIMREALAKRANMAEEEGAESGFTLIELMVVLLIIAILLAIAIPTFLGVTGSSYDRQAQSNLTNELTALKADFTNAQGYDTAVNEVANLNNSNPTLTAISGAANTGYSTATNSMSVMTFENDGATAATSTANGVVAVIATWSAKTNTCWFAEDSEQTSGQAHAAGTWFTAAENYGAGTQYGSLTAQADDTTCWAGNAQAVTNWQGNGYPA
jgi:type IV pilus assembly protein PilA